MNTVKKLIPVIATTATIILILYIIGQVTGALKTLKTRTISNVPAIKPGDSFFSTNLLSPKRYDLISFYYQPPQQQKQLWAYRVCGMPGDTVLIKNGELYINGYPADRSLNLHLAYLVPKNSLTTIIKQIGLSDEESNVMGDSAIVFINTDQTGILNELKIPYKRYTGFDQPVPVIAQIFHHAWTPDNFGPLAVPEKHYFVMGDNRYNAQDSRFIGCIPEKDVYGVIIGRH